MAPDDTLSRNPLRAGDVSAQASNLDALMIEVSLTADRGTPTVCGSDDTEPELVAVRSLVARAAARLSEGEWEAHADAVIFGWLVSP
jgi:hypothetical protein